MSELTKDEEILLAKYRDAKTMRWADLSLSIEAGQVARLWVTEKTDVGLLKSVTRMKE